MIHILSMLVFMLIINSHVNAQNTNRYVGLHYGDHPDWKYFNEVTTEKRGDTLFYSQNRYNRAKLKDAHKPDFYQRIALLKKKDGFRILHDSINYFQGLLIMATTTNESTVSIESNRLPSPLTLDKGSIPYFSSLEALELYLTYTALHSNYEANVHLGVNENNNALRKFKVKVVGELKTVPMERKTGEAYKVAIISLNDSNAMDARLLIDKDNGNVLEKEYIVNERSEPNNGPLKSIGYEHVIPEDYMLDLTEIQNPKIDDYLEVAFSHANNGSKNFELSEFF